MNRGLPVIGHKAHVAQQVEHILGKNGVTGSNPVVGSMNVYKLVPIRNSTCCDAFQEDNQKWRKGGLSGRSRM